MCGITAVFSCGAPNPNRTAETKRLVREATQRLQHRGPDAINVVGDDVATFGHTRLVIQGNSEISQPFVEEDGRMLAVNGEIYNAAELGTDVEKSSDCYSIMKLLYFDYFEDGEELTPLKLTLQLKQLDGVFAFVYYDAVHKRIVAARSLCGVMPLYYGLLETRLGKKLVFCSERKAFPDAKLNIFPPEMFISITCEDLSKIETLQDICLYRYEWILTPHTQKNQIMNGQRLEYLMKRAVQKRISTVKHGKIAYLLSGGLDSSIVVALARELFPNQEICTFSIGLEGGQSPDLKAARQVAEYCRTSHTEYTFTVEEGLQAVPHVVQAVESLDTTTIRASTPMWLLIRNIKRDFPDVKVIMSGEGADELCRGYLCFHEFQTLEDSTDYSMQLMRRLHKFDVQRAHQCSAAHGCETRVPFLDYDLVHYLMQLDPAFLTPILGQEKYFLRRMMDTKLPESIVRRTKEQFSDGVGYKWINALRDGTWHELKHSPESLCAYISQSAPTGGREQLNIFDIFRDRLGEKAFEAACRSLHTWIPGAGKTKDASGRASRFHPSHITV